MDQGTEEGLILILTILVYALIFAFVISILYQVVGEGSNPGFIKNVFEIISGRFGRLGVG